MKHFTIPALLVVLVTMAATLQRSDLASYLSGDATLPPMARINSATTGEWVDLANFSGAALVITTGQVDAAVYVVLQDSSAGLAVAVSDSIQITATSDTTYLDLGYKGSRRFIRALQRATGSAADSVVSAVAVVRSGARKP